MRHRSILFQNYPGIQKDVEIHLRENGSVYVTVNHGNGEQPGGELGDLKEIVKMAEKMAAEANPLCQLHGR